MSRGATGTTVVCVRCNSRYVQITESKRVPRPLQCPCDQLLTAGHELASRGSTGQGDNAKALSSCVPPKGWSSS